MAYKMRTEGLEELGEMLRKMGDEAIGAASRALYEGAGIMADELKHTLSQYQDLSDEINANINMRPIVCTIISKSDSNYFSRQFRKIYNLSPREYRNGL